MSFRITTIHAIVGIEPGTDEEGVPAYIGAFGPTPLIAADEERLSLIIGMAQQLANQIGHSFKIVRFSVREDIGEIKPDGKPN